MTTIAKKLPPLFSRTSTGAIQEWSIEIDGDRYRTTYGQIEGKKVTTEWMIAKPTNVGRANERLGAEQAEFEAQAIWKKKTEQGYYASVQDIDKPAFIEPMLAKKYEDFDPVYPCFSQPKLDGIRCICTINGMFSRAGKRILSAPHIRESLNSFFESNPDVILDGELYCDKLANDFNKIASLVKKMKPTAAELAESATTIQYWVYDILDTEKNFNERNRWICDNITLNGHIVPVPTAVVTTQEQLDELYGQYLSHGYEGQMIRLNGVYEQKRSKFLLKRKTFQDAEYKILEVCEGTGNRTGMAGWMVLENRDGSSFKSNIKGSHDFLKELWTEKESVIGEKATVQFFNLTPDNVPRFPYVIAIRNYE